MGKVTSAQCTVEPLTLRNVPSEFSQNGEHMAAFYGLAKKVTLPARTASVTTWHRAFNDTKLCICSLFFMKEMELSLIGLQNAGKTSLVNVLTTGAFHEDMIPTVGFNMRKVTKGAVTIKLWDLGGQVMRCSSRRGKTH